MAFIKKVIGPDEKMIGITMVHWIYGAKGLLWMAGMMILGSSVNFLFHHFFGTLHNEQAAIALNIFSSYFFWVCTGIGVILFILYFLMMVTTEVGLTTKRVIYKRGWLLVKVIEADIEEIKAANIDNGIFGRFLNYGFIFFDTRFVENLTLPAVSDPYRFVKAMNEARSALKQGPTTTVVVGDDHKHEDQDKQGDNVSVTTQGKQGDFDGAASHVNVQVPPPPPVHQMDEKRYDSMTDNPIRAVGEVMSEAGKGLSQSAEQMAAQSQEKKPAKKPGIFARRRPKPPARPEGETPPPEMLVFDRDPKARKEELRRKIKTAFAKKTRKKTP